jgi:hypothetical protein
MLSRKVMHLVRAEKLKIQRELGEHEVLDRKVGRLAGGN